MPIVDMQFENGIFFAREVGTISRNDAEVWADMLRQFARHSPEPVVILIDATQLGMVTPDAGKVFTRAAETPNVRVAAIAAGAGMAELQSRMISLMSRVGQTHETHVFAQLAEAQRFALEHVGARTG
jgi:hypothetical protein